MPSGGSRRLPGCSSRSGRRDRRRTRDPRASAGCTRATRSGRRDKAGSRRLAGSGRGRRDARISSSGLKVTPPCSSSDRDRARAQHVAGIGNVRLARLRTLQPQRERVQSLARKGRQVRMHPLAQQRIALLHEHRLATHEIGARAERAGNPGGGRVLGVADREPEVRAVSDGALDRAARLAARPSASPRAVPRRAARPGCGSGSGGSRPGTGATTPREPSARGGRRGSSDQNQGLGDLHVPTNGRGPPVQPRPGAGRKKDGPLAASARKHPGAASVHGSVSSTPFNESTRSCAQAGARRRHRLAVGRAPGAALARRRRLQRRVRRRRSAGRARRRLRPI